MFIIFSEHLVFWDPISLTVSLLYYDIKGDGWDPQDYPGIFDSASLP